MNKIVVSARDLEQIKLLMVELQALAMRLDEARSPEAATVLRMLRRFKNTHIEDDRAVQEST